MGAAYSHRPLALWHPPPNGLRRLRSARPHAARQHPEWYCLIEATVRTEPTSLPGLNAPVAAVAAGWPVVFHPQEAGSRCAALYAFTPFDEADIDGCNFFECAALRSPS